ncbi:MAG: peptidylprolyl isomerase [Anaerolineales bacterium]|nr:peptidylprolyl isomerase [Anaerolineales bacterium]
MRTSLTSLPRRYMPQFLLIFLGLTACGTIFGPAITPTPISPSLTPAPPTQTPVPMAAIVNNEGITVTEYQAELDRFQAAQTALGNGITPEEASQRVIDDLVDQMLLAQGARAAGFEVNDAVLQTRLDALTEKVGGMDALAAWQSAHGYTSETFHETLRQAIAAAWMRDQVIAEVPVTIDQVHVQQILLYNEDKARKVLEQIQSGAEFEALASIYDPLTRGDLGWFPKGYLLESKIEEVAFSLQPGEISDVIVTDVGYHIIKVLEGDPQHPLSPDACLTLQNLALRDWLRQKRLQSTIVLSL